MAKDQFVANFEDARVGIECIGVPGMIRHELSCLSSSLGDDRLGDLTDKLC